MKSTNDFQTSNPEMVTISRAEYEEKNARLASQDERIARLESQIELLTEALRLARHKRFGASSEKTDESVMEQMSFLFNEAEVFSAAEKRNRNPPMWQATSGTRSIPTPWTPSRKESPRSRWSIVWRVRIWSALSVGIP